MTVRMAVDQIEGQAGLSRMQSPVGSGIPFIEISRIISLTFNTLSPKLLP